MALILHLTDLHLGSLTQGQVLDDYKSDIVPYEERVRRESVLRSTLHQLKRYLSTQQLVLDAVVISGDVAVAGDPSGFEMLPGVLSELAEALPPPERIMVVPGNHDVSWRTVPSSPERYEHFVKLLRTKGYITPFLDGIDLPVKDPAAVRSQHRLMLDDGAVEIVPLNSSNYCGSLEPLHSLTEMQWSEIPNLLNLSNAQAIRKELDRLRLLDAVRFNPEQLDAVSELLHSLSTLGQKRKPIRIAVLHHQLLPVSVREEFKAYESIANLGMFRRFLRTNGFDIVLHGHKHTDCAYWYDLGVEDGSDIPARTKPRALVISGPALGGSGSGPSVIGSLIALNAKICAKDVILTPIPASHAGAVLGRLDDLRFRLWDKTGISADLPDAAKVLSAETSEEAYNQLMSYFVERSEHDAVWNMVCEIRNTTHPVRLPFNYPKLPEGVAADRQTWLNELVRWWQDPATARDDPSAFTHGSRIYKFAGNRDQFQGALNALKNKAATSRAVIVLADPPRDGWDASRKAPSFCSLQLVIAERGKDLVLDCVAYFRKQEMRYWWPVNYAELASLQKKAIEELSTTYTTLRPGSIITIASIAYASQTLPKVAVPLIDRLLIDDADTLWQLAHSLVWPNPAESIPLTWDRLLSDLTPDDKPDPDGVPVAIQGLKDLICEMKRFSRFHPGPDIEEAAAAFSNLLQANEIYADKASTDEPSNKLHTEWRNKCLLYVADIRKIVERCGLKPDATN